VPTPAYLSLGQHLHRVLHWMLQPEKQFTRNHGPYVRWTSLDRFSIYLEDCLFTWKEVYAVPTPAYLSLVQHLHRGTYGGIAGLEFGVDVTYEVFMSDLVLM